MSVKLHIVAWITFPLAVLTGTACEAQVTPAEARGIAKEAYIYGFPMVDNLRIQYAYFVDKGNPEYKAPYNQLFNIRRVYTPEDKAIQRPNSDTPYSWIGQICARSPSCSPCRPLRSRAIGACSSPTCIRTTSTFWAPAPQATTAAAS
jgi:hypothetical protein